MSLPIVSVPFGRSSGCGESLSQPKRKINITARHSAPSCFMAFLIMKASYFALAMEYTSEFSRRYLSLLLIDVARELSGYFRKAFHQKRVKAAALPALYHAQ